MIKIYYAEDSPTAVHALRRALSAAPDVVLVGVGRNGEEAKADIPRLQPDVVLTDLVMPVVDGHALIAWLMENHPVPVLVLSDQTATRATAAAFRAIEAGALDVSPKPRAGADAAGLIARVRVLAGVRVVRRRPSPRASAEPPPRAERRSIEIVAVGASTGGPGALRRVLGRLPAGFAIPVLVVQHIGAEFLPSLVAWLADTLSLRVEVAAGGVAPRGGTVYVAPADAHLRLAPGGKLEVAADAPLRGYRPSVDVLFGSVARAAGERACGVLLTGMGDDGAAELERIRRAGGLTLAQDEASCAVFGMPRTAALRGAAERVLDPESIGDALAALPSRGASPR